MTAAKRSDKAGKGSARRRALFMMHNFNDIDHMTPVIDALMKTGRWRCTAVFYPHATGGSIQFESDWRLAYLRSEHGVSAAHIKELDPSIGRTLTLWRFREALTRLCKRTPGIGRLFGRDLRGLLPWFLLLRAVDPALTLYLSRLSPTGRNLLERTGADVVAVDWGQTHALIYPLIRLARKKGLRILQLPHGAWTYEGIYSHVSQFDPGKLMKKIRLPETRADAMVVDNLYKGYRSDLQGIPRERMRFLGLARFAPAWLDALAALPKGTAALPTSGKPRVVWFPTWLMACDLDAVDASLAALEVFSDRIDIVLKVHTRNPANEMEDYGRRLHPDSRIRLVANEQESFAMTRWADAVIVTQSSIVYDAFMLGKPVLYLKYTHGFDCMWEADGVGETVRDAEHLRSILGALADGSYRPGYKSEAVARYLRLAVHGGLDPEAVLPAYVELFEQAASGAPLKAGYSFAEAEDQWRAADRRIVDVEPVNQAA